MLSLIYLFEKTNIVYFKLIRKSIGKILQESNYRENILLLFFIRNKTINSLSKNYYDFNYNLFSFTYFTN